MFIFIWNNDPITTMKWLIWEILYWVSLFTEIFRVLGLFQVTKFKQICNYTLLLIVSLFCSYLSIFG